ncbi:MAG: 3'-5' exonuclease [Pontiellaceae bacterium]|nr:3'-5' exonuclease [Pontiellaceae bacterium]MBN2784462.1 3'-5' exonuclease [Pontiellaceae bacterium]
MDAHTPITNAVITVLDFETTGTVRGFDNEPWQIGMVGLRHGRVDEESLFESLMRIDINRPFNPHAPGRHVLLRDELATAPSPQEVWLKLMPRLTEYPLCAHNVATEKKFTRLMAPMHRFGMWIDTLRIARKVWPGCPSYALEDLTVMLDIKPRIEALCPAREAHDALYDAVASAALLEHLLEQPGWADISISELARL